ESVLQRQNAYMHALRYLHQRLYIFAVGVLRRDLIVQALPDVGELHDQRVAVVPELNGRRQDRAGAEQPEQANHAGDIGRIVVSGKKSVRRQAQIRVVALQLQTCNAVAKRNGQLASKSYVVRFVAGCCIASKMGDSLSFGLRPTPLAVDISPQRGKRGD